MLRRRVVSRRAVAAVVICVAAALPIAAPAAHADAFQDVVAAYRKDQRIDPCAFSETVLRDAQGQIPPSIEQTDPDFPGALADAIDARTQGACAGRATPATTTPSTTPVPPTATTPASPPTTPQTTPAPPSGQTTPAPPLEPGQRPPPGTAEPSSEDGGLGPGTVLLIVVGAIALLLLGYAALRAWMGWDGRRTRKLRHAWGEAGYRVGNAWSSFTDWLRVSR